MKLLVVVFVFYAIGIDCLEHKDGPTDLQHKRVSKVDMEIDYYSDNDRNVFEVIRRMKTTSDNNDGRITKLEVFPDDTPTALDSWSVIWYIISFGGLIAFFMVVSCSEWCCRRSARNSNYQSNTPSGNSRIPDNPPPSYDEFAPPPYESICIDGSCRGKDEYEVYVVPVGNVNSVNESAEDNPPSYNILEIYSGNINLPPNNGSIQPSRLPPSQLWNDSSGSSDINTYIENNVNITSCSYIPKEALNTKEPHTNSKRNRESEDKTYSIIR